MKTQTFGNKRVMLDGVKFMVYILNDAGGSNGKRMDKMDYDD